MLIGWGTAGSAHQVLSSLTWLISLPGSLTLFSESLKTMHEISASGKTNSKQFPINKYGVTVPLARDETNGM